MKKLVAVVLASAMVLSMAACGNSGSGSTQAAAPAQTQAAAPAQTQAAAPAAAPAETKAAEAAPAAAEGTDTLKVIQNFDPQTFEPGNNDEQGYNRMMVQIYDTLFRFDENGELQPWLAESYEWDDELHLRLHLREGVKFSDGSDFTAEDVVWTITRAIDEALPNAKYNIIDRDECSVVDDHTCILGLKYACGTMPNHLANDQCAIGCKAAFERSGDWLDPNGAVVGTGPYKLVEYVPGDIVRLTANEYCWIPDQPKTKNVDVRIVTSMESAATEAKTLQYDLVYGANTREFEQIDALDGVHMEYGQTAKTIYLLINMKHAPMDNVKVREAFARAINVPMTVKLAYGVVAAPAEAFIVPTIGGANKETYRKYFGEGQDIEAAKALLAEAGYPNGVDLEITVESQDTQRCDMAEAMQAQVLDAGINLSVNKMESAPMREYIGAGEHMMCLYGFTANTMEADGFLSQLQPGSGALARIGYERQEFFDRYKEGCAMPELSDRVVVWEECLEMLMEDYAAIPLNHVMLGAAVKDDLKGFWWAKDYEEFYYGYMYKE